MNIQADCYVDLEFSQNGEIIEIGAFINQDSLFQSYVKPNIKVSKFIKRLTRITDSTLDLSPSFTDTMDRFCKWLEEEAPNRIISWSLSDQDVLKKNCELQNYKHPILAKLFDNWVDGQAIYCKATGYDHLGQLPSIDTALLSLGLVSQGRRHSALYDSANCALIINALSDPSNRRAIEALRWLMITEKADLSFTLGEVMGKIAIA